MSDFGDWWNQKKKELKSLKRDVTLDTIKVLCYIAWMRGARIELDKEIKVLKKATLAMNRRARTRAIRKKK